MQQELLDVSLSLEATIPQQQPISPTLIILYLVSLALSIDLDVFVKLLM